MSKTVNFSVYNPRKEDIILLDTNIIIDLFYPINIGRDLQDVSQLYGKILKSGAIIIMTSLQVSEFVNRCIRFQFNLYQKDHPECEDYKHDYRGTENYKDSMESIMDVVQNEWKDHVRYIDDKFNELPLDKIFDVNGTYDFNDAVIVEIANKYNAILVTNDGDFINYDVKNKIVSSNWFLLAKH